MRVENLVIELDLVFEACSAAIESTNSLFFVAINRNFRLLGLEGPRLLVVDHSLYLVLLLD